MIHFRNNDECNQAVWLFGSWVMNTLLATSHFMATLSELVYQDLDEMIVFIAKTRFVFTELRCGSV